MTPRYPIYIPSKGRFENCLTAKFLTAEGVPFHLVVEAQQAEEYASRFGPDRIIVLPFRDKGLITARNWIKDHATSAGHLRHWQLDDNIQCVYRCNRRQRIRCDSATAFSVAEDLTDRYENVAISGLNYDMFNPGGLPPFSMNCRIYSCTLVLNSIPHRWRLRYNDDTDICLQVLADGWCTILVNAFLAKKEQTMTIKGGNTTDLYQGDGRLKMARALERLWPGVVKTDRRFQRPQHVVKDSWKKFDTPLKLKPGIDLSTIAPNEYGLTLQQVRPIKSESLRKLVEGHLTDASSR